MKNDFVETITEAGIQEYYMTIKEKKSIDLTECIGVHDSNDLEFIMNG